MINVMETPASPEKQERQSEILLHFMRHGEKAKSQNGQSDYEVRLTPEGRQKAKAKAGKTNLRQAMAIGSPRERAQETVALVMAGFDNDITGNENFNELKEKIDSWRGSINGARISTQVFSDKRLDFTLDDKTPLGAKEMEAYLAKRYLSFVVSDTDRLAEELGDRETSTYSKMAGAVAEIVKKYAKVADRWHELVNDEKKQYEETMERFLGSHGGVTESFLAKIIEKTKSIEERDNFVKAVGNQFDFLEGFEVKIIKKSGNDASTIHIKYQKNNKDGEGIFSFDEEIPTELIDEIIKEGEKK